jgi:transcriptional regulator with GAF, ATPase, and Fis domain
VKVGSIAANRIGLLLTDPSSEQWARPEWVRDESIQSFAGQPLVFRDETLGALAVFRRQSINDQEFRWLRMFADQAASAIANARAFSELDRLRQQLEFHNAYLKEEVQTALAFGSIVGQSGIVQRVLEQVDDVARTDATVLILGESGTGKELLANEIHHRGRRAQRNFVRVNCSAIPREVFESEFFGHARGAFTGALRDRPGRFQIADGGTIFLDEIGELPLDMQPKLLRVLQEGQCERVGEDVTRKVDVRVVTARIKICKQRRAPVDCGRISSTGCPTVHRLRCGTGWRDLLAWRRSRQSQWRQSRLRTPCAQWNRNFRPIATTDGSRMTLAVTGTSPANFP